MESTEANHRKRQTIEPHQAGPGWQSQELYAGREEATMTDKRPMTKERLQRYTRLVQEIDRQFDALEIMEEKLTSPKSSNLTGMPKSGNSSFDRMAMAIGKRSHWSSR